MKSCTIAETLTLRAAADDYVAADPTLLNYYNHHVYRVYNMRRFFEAGGASMITPYDGGFRPTTYSLPHLLLENGDNILLESGGAILLEY